MAKLPTLPTKGPLPLRVRSRLVDLGDVAHRPACRLRGHGRVAPHFMGDLPVVVDSARRRNITLVGV